MAQIARVRTVMTGVAGSPFYNNLHYSYGGTEPADDYITVTRDLWFGLLQFSDQNIDAQVQAEVDIVDDSTGIIVSSMTGASATATGGQVPPSLPPSSQLLINLTTGTIVNGRRIRGKIFIPGPCGAAGVTEPLSSTITTLQGVLNDWETDCAAAGFERLVFSPTNLQSTAVAGATPWNKFAVLRSRRD